MNRDRAPSLARARRSRRCCRSRRAARTTTPTAGHRRGDGTTLTVLAAASLTETFTTLADDFEADPRRRRRSSSPSTPAPTLAEQAVDGAPGDVLATADETTMQIAVDADVAGDGPETFADQRAGAGHPARQPGRHHVVRRPRRRRRTSSASTTRPAARSRRRCSRPAGSPPSRPASRSTSRPCSAKVTSDEADAGIVYATDAVAAGDDVTVDRHPEAPTSSPTSYPIATLDAVRGRRPGPGVHRPGAVRRGPGRCSRTPASVRAVTRRRALGGAHRRCCWSRPLVAAVLLVVPLVAMVARHPLGRASARSCDRSRSARRCRLSLLTSLARWLVCLVLGTPAGLAARARRLPRPRRCCGPLVTVPLVLPPVVAGVALRDRVRPQRGHRRSRCCELTGISLPFTTTARGARAHLRLDAVRA